MNDIINIKFTEVTPGTVVSFAVGPTFDQAKGEKISQPLNKLLRVAFPNSLYLSVEHEVDDVSGKFGFEFWYLD